MYLQVPDSSVCYLFLFGVDISLFTDFNYGIKTQYSYT